MDYPIKSKEIAKGVRFHSIIDSRYKSNFISVNLCVPLKNESVSTNAIIPFLLKKGYADCPDFTQLNKKLSRLYGAYLSGDVSKHGDMQILRLTAYAIDNQYTLDNENITQQISEIIAGCLLNPAFENDLFFKESDVNIEKQMLIDLIEGEINDKRLYAVNRLKEIMCKNEPFGIHQYGHVDKVKKLRSNEITQSYHHLIQTAPIEIIYVGCGGDDIACAAFSSAFKNVQRREISKSDSIVVKEIKSIREETEVLNVEQSKLVLGFRTGCKPNDILSTPMLVMNTIYGSSPVSKLFMNVREKLSLCYYCAARYDRTKGIITVESGVENQNIQTAKDEILKQLFDVQQGGISSEEIEQAKLTLVNNLNSVNDYANGVAFWYLNQLLYKTQDTPNMLAEKIKKVEKQEIVQAANLVELDTAYVLTNKEEKKA